MNAAASTPCPPTGRGSPAGRSAERAEGNLLAVARRPDRQVSLFDITDL